MPSKRRLNAGNDESPEATPRTQSVEMLDEDHRQCFLRAVANVLSTDIAEITMAQIVDGYPIADVAWDTYHGGILDSGHPLYEKHKHLCPGVLEKSREISAAFQAEKLEFNVDLLRAFMTASIGSKAFNTRLIELVARAIHAIALRLSQTATGFHRDDDEFNNWYPDGTGDDSFWMIFYRDGKPPPTIFIHAWYFDYDAYPNGIADGVGYWAEARILGGVVLFDRRDPYMFEDADPNEIYLHSDRENITYRIYSLLDEQKRQLIEFLCSDRHPAPRTPEQPPDECPIPIRGGKDNRKRVDPEEPILKTGIYRDPRERKPIPPSLDIRKARKCVVDDLFNYNSREDWGAAVARARVMEREWYANGANGPS